MLRVPETEAYYVLDIVISIDVQGRLTMAVLVTFIGYVRLGRYVMLPFVEDTVN